jgi:hypothetical protein
MTERADLEGTLARWFATDALGQLGIFSGAYAAWPAAIFADYSIVQLADDVVAGSSPSTEGIATPRHRERQLRRYQPQLPYAPSSPDYPILEASQGFFSFDADIGYGGSTVYFLDAVPRSPLLIDDAPPLIRRAAQLVRLSVQFSAIDSLDLEGHVEYVVGRG